MINLVNSNSSNFVSFTATKANDKVQRNTNDNNLSTSFIVKDKSQAVSEVLGYGVDSEGFFTSDFNEKAGLAGDIRIHSGIAGLIDRLTTTNKAGTLMLGSYTSIDLAQSLGNAYKALSQLISPEQKNITQSDIDNLPVALDVKGFDIVKTYDLKAYQQLKDKKSNDEVRRGTFFIRGQGDMMGGNFTRINLDDEFKDGIYKNADGSIQIGGILHAFFAETGIGMVSQTSVWGKIQGLDATMSKAQIKDLQDFMENNKILDGSSYGYNAQFDFVGDLRLYHLLNSDLSVDEFKEQYLALKEKFENEYFVKKNTSSNQTNTNSPNATQTDTEQNTIKKRSPIQVTSKSETYTSSYFAKYKNLLEDTQKMNMFEILFGAKSGISNNANSNGFLDSTSAFNTNGTDLNTNLMNLNLSQIKALSKVDIKA